MSLMSSLQLLSLGIVGEYVGNIQTMVQNRPFAFERERINFEYPPGEPLREALQTVSEKSVDERETSEAPPFR
jgi:hypothetical protein